jgi:hypothetical protein
VRRPLRSAVFALTLCACSLAQSVHINAGAADDRYFTGGWAYAYPGAPASLPTMRYGNFSYSIPLAPGDYTVSLTFVERIVSAPGAHIFSVAANGTPLLSSLDIFAEVGWNTPLVKSFPVTVGASGLTLTLIFSTEVRNASVNAIDITPVVVTLPPPSTGLNLLTGTAPARPQVCPSSVLTIYASTDTPDIWYCTPGRPWVDLNILSSLASIIQAGAFGVGYDPKTLTIGPNCTPQTPCNARLGGVTYSFTAASTVTLSGGSGVASIFLDPTGALAVGSSLPLACAGQCVVMPGVTSFPSGSIPLWTWSATNGTWDANGGTDRRGFLSRERITAGAGIQVVDAGDQTIVSAIDATRCIPQAAAKMWTISQTEHGRGSDGLVVQVYDDQAPRNALGTGWTVDRVTLAVVVGPFAVEQAGCVVIR